MRVRWPRRLAGHADREYAERAVALADGREGAARGHDEVPFELTPGPPERTAVMIESTITSEVVAAPTER